MLCVGCAKECSPESAIGDGDGNERFNDASDGNTKCGEQRQKMELKGAA
jgi:hypothetical protein